MNARKGEQAKRTEPTVLESMRARGMRSKGFAEGYERRDVIIQTARAVREMRTAAGITQAELARRAGMSQPEISRLETGFGKQGPSVETLDRLAKACNLQFAMGPREAVAPIGEEGGAGFKFDAGM